MELAFETKELRTLCEIETEAQRKLKNGVAEALKHRIADLKAASSPKELVVGRPRPDPTSDVMVIDLGEGYRLAFVPNHPKSPRTSSGVIDWSRVSRVRIISIEAEQ